MPLVNVVNLQNGDIGYLFLLTITDPSSETVIHLVNNTEDIVRGGITYTAFPFSVVLPPDNGVTSASLKVETFNIGRPLIELMRGTLEPPSVKIELILTEDYEAPAEKTFDFMTLRNLSYDNQSVSFELAGSTIFARKTCSGTYSQAEFPGLFFALQ